MDNLIAIANLNDFIFCPYSIYLHNVYMSREEDTYKAAPQIKGTAAHKHIDENSYSSRCSDITSLPVYSERWGLTGKIDIYKANENALIERKYKIHQLYQGQIYQLYAQYFCMIEMGYPVTKLSIYSMSDNRNYPIGVPDERQTEEFSRFIERYKAYDPSQPIVANPNKCAHCIYANLCDYTYTDHVY